MVGASGHRRPSDLPHETTPYTALPRRHQEPTTVATVVLPLTGSGRVVLVRSAWALGPSVGRTSPLRQGCRSRIVLNGAAAVCGAGGTACSHRRHRRGDTGGDGPRGGPSRARTIVRAHLRLAQLPSRSRQPRIADCGLRSRRRGSDASVLYAPCPMETNSACDPTVVMCTIDCCRLYSMGLLILSRLDPSCALCVKLGGAPNDYLCAPPARRGSA